MAQYPINYKCGHSEVVALYGKHTDRHAKIEWMEGLDCPACRAKGSVLTGSERQIAWAESIKADTVPEILKVHAEMSGRLAAATPPEGHPTYEQDRADLLAAMEAYRDELLSRTAAWEWIDGRETPVYDLFAAKARAVRRAATEGVKGK